MAGAVNRCTGLLGWIFGHKFIKGAGEYLLERDFCWRCGYKRGTR